MRKLVICEINESYIKSVKEQMEKQNIPLPKDDSQVTIAHKPVKIIEVEKLNCTCEVCKKLR